VHTTVPVAAFFVIQPYVLWPDIAGATIALIGLFAAWRVVSTSQGSDKLLALSSMFFAVPLAAFGAEHLTIANAIASGVPSWIPWHLFWAYFVGLALIAAALSIATKIQARLSSTLLGCMIFFFVLTLHTPRILANPNDRIAWAVALRDLAFVGGAWALAGTQTEHWRAQGTNNLITVGRFLIAIAAIFFAVEHFLHPEHLPGVPLEKLTPLWIPARLLIGYLTGAVLLFSGISLLLGKKMRTAATCLGIVILALVLFVYFPVMIAIPSAADGGVKIEGLNYFFDTLMFAGAITCLAAALPKRDVTM
jgi:uncharacterized membrane protein